MPIVIEIERLPHPLAAALRGHALEERPFVRAWRLCEAVEMLTRFLTAAALAEIAAHAGEAGFPPALRRVMTNGLGRPTFGAWAAILREARAALPPSERMLAPGLGEVIDEVLDAVGLPTDPLEAKVLSFRNALAHDWFPDDQIQRLLGEHGHEARFEALWSGRVATLLGGLELLGRTDAGGWCVLRGVPQDPGRFPPGSADRLQATSEQRASWTPGVVLLTRAGSSRWLSVYPLQAFAPVLHRMDGRVKTAVTQPIGQIYSRATPLIQYTALHPRVGHGDASELTQATFDALYPLAAWREALQQAAEARDADQALRQAVRPFRFRDVVEPLLTDAFLGRQHDLAAVLAWLDAHPSGAGLVTAAPGMGKTALAARLSVRLGQERKTWLCLRHFFKADDDRCSARQFMTGVLLQLRLAGAIATELPAPADQARRVFLDALATFAREQLGGGDSPRRLIILVDGLDEIAQREPEFLGLVAARPLPNVTWLCFGRAERAVLDALPDSAVPRVLGDEGLGPLDRRAVREYLLEELDARRAEYLQHESPDGTSAFLDALTDGVRSLPLYQQLVVEDIRRGLFQFDHPDQLPASLGAYYDRLVQRLAMDAARKVLPDVIALLAMAYKPLTAGMLSTLLADHDLRRDPDWERILGESLRLGHVVMTRGHLWNETVGYTLYHPSFRDHLRAGARRSYAEFPMAPVLRAARQRLLSLCRRWAELPPGSDERRYAMSLAHRHLIEANDVAGLAALVTPPAGAAPGDFVSEIARTPGLTEGDALEAAASIVCALAGAGDERWPDMLRGAEQYGRLAAAGRRNPRMIEQMIAERRFRDVMLTISAQPDLYVRGALMLASAPLLEAAGQSELAGQLWREGVQHVSQQLGSGLDALEGHRAEAGQLADALYRARSAGLASGRGVHAMAAHRPVLPETLPARARLPRRYLVLAWLGAIRPLAYFPALWVSVIGMALLLAFAQKAIFGDVLPHWLALSAGLIFLVLVLAMLLLAPLGVLARGWLSRHTARIDALMTALSAGIQHAPDPREERRRLSHGLRLRRYLGVDFQGTVWPGQVAYWFARRFQLRTSTVDGARLLLDASLERMDVARALMAELHAVEPQQVSAIFRAVLARTLPGFDDEQLLRLLVAAGSRLDDPGVLVDYLEHLRGGWADDRRVDPWPILVEADQRLLGRALLVSLAPSRSSPQSAGLGTFAAALNRRIRSLLRQFGPRRLRSHAMGYLFVLFVAPAVALFFGAISVPLSWLGAIVILGIRQHDPFGISGAMRSRNAAEARPWLAQRLPEPALSWRAMRAWLVNLRGWRHEWLLNPIEVRRIREHVIVQALLRDEPNDFAVVPISSVRRIATALARVDTGRRVVALILGFMGDPQVLDVIRRRWDVTRPARARRSPEPAADAAELVRVLPLSSWTSLGLSLALSILVMQLWLRLVVVLVPIGAATRLLQDRRLIAIAGWACVSQHLPALLGLEALIARWLPSLTEKGRLLIVQLLLGGVAVGLIFTVGKGFVATSQYLLIVPFLVTGWIVPGLIARWRGAELFYPTAGELWQRRLVSLGWLLAVCVVLALLTRVLLS